jgi:hypothetical protein
VTGYLFVVSAEQESGKTRLLEVLRELVLSALFTMNISDAALYRAIDSLKPTLFMDEIDAVFNPKARERGVAAEKSALLNGGYRRGERVYRMGGANRTTLEAFEVFCPKALAGLGSLPPTLASRCFRIELKRRRVDEPVEDFYPAELAEETAAMRAQLEAWAETAIDELQDARPARIDELRDRTNEVWRPLLAIAELAGGVWAARARHAATHLASGERDDETTVGVLLLADIRIVFAELDEERLATARLITELCKLEESPWAEWWLTKEGDPSRAAPRRLAQLLRPFRIRATNIRAEDTVKRGYKVEDFRDAWERFLPDRVAALQALHPLHPAPHQQTEVADVVDVAHRGDGKVSDENVTKSAARARTL